jgi:hypothetical protein|tara:strand:+ start:626 stop:1534 length:909 start_codon:yes stop_codon:yes gene_type:complete
MSLSEKALLLTVDFSIPSGRKVDKQVSNDIADQYNIEGGRKSSGNFNKITIDSKYLKEPQNIKRKVINAFDNMTLPWLNNGIKVNLLPNTQLMAFSKVWRDARREMDQYIWKLENGLYDEMMQDSKDRLNGQSSDDGGLFSEWDYPPVEAFVSKFKMQQWVRPVPDADSLDLRVAVGEAEAERIKEDIKDSIAQQFEKSKEYLCNRIVENVEHMKKVLSGKNKNGNPVIHDTLMEKMEQLVNILPELNFADDQEIEDIRRRIRDELLEDVDVLRKDAGARDDVLSSTDDILNRMEKIYGMAK